MVCLLVFVFAFVVFGSVGYAQTITDVVVNNFSNPDRLSANGNSITREYASSIVATSPVVTNNGVSEFTNHFSWFQGMRVNQPAAPNFALLYRHNVGYSLQFTVEDPGNNGYSLHVDYANHGYTTVSREELVRVDARMGLMLGRLDDGSGPIHYPGFYIGGGATTVFPNNPDSFQSKRIDVEKSFTAPVEYVGTRTFEVSFSSFPSFALLSLFQNYGGGESIVQFGLPATHQSDDATRPNFQYATYTGPDDESLDSLGQFVTVRIESLGMGCVPQQEVCDGEDNDCDGLIDDDDSDVLGENFYQDLDQDGYGNPHVSLNACEPSEGYVENASDCDDTSGIRYPGNPEVCDGLDNDCDDVIDNGVDEDGDGIEECFGEDQCLQSSVLDIDLGDLKPNHHVVPQDTMEFVTFSKKQYMTSYSLQETAGCTCMDILQLSKGNMEGQMKYGCSVGVINAWIKSRL